MAEYFDISQLSGTGPATITIKPKSVNNTENYREQLLKVRVKDVERVITLNQGPKVVIMGDPIFNLDKASVEFAGNTTNEKAEVSFNSYRQQYINNVPQEVYEAVVTTFVTSTEWITVEEVEKPNGKSPGRISIKTTSKNSSLDEAYNPISRSGQVTFLQEGIEVGILIVTQTAGSLNWSFSLDNNGGILHSGQGVVGGWYEGAVTIKPIIGKIVNDKTVKEYEAYIKIPTLSNKWSYNGQIKDFMGASKTYTAEAEVTNYGSIASSFVSTQTLTCRGIVKSNYFPDPVTQVSNKAYPSWPISIDTSRLPTGCTLTDLIIEDFYFRI